MLTLAKPTQATALTALQSINSVGCCKPQPEFGSMPQAAPTGETDCAWAQRPSITFPQIAAVIHSNGLQTREFIVITGAIINDVKLVGMKMQGMIAAYPPESSRTTAGAALVQVGLGCVSGARPRR